MPRVWSGVCARCGSRALLYPARKAGKLIGICYGCREIMKEKKKEMKKHA